MIIEWLKECINTWIWVSHVDLNITDLCDDVTCQNGGICKVNKGKPYCQCAVKYVGDYCEKRE